MLRSYLRSILKEHSLINARLDNAEIFLQNIGITNKIREMLKQMPDMEKSIAKITSSRCTHKDMQLKKGLTKALLKKK